MTRRLPRSLPAGLEALTALALDLRWTWSHAADALWRTIDAEVWDKTQNPWFLLQDVPLRRLEELASDPSFRGTLTRLAKERERRAQGPTWFSTSAARLQKERIAYFSMEFGLGEAIPLYAGGLGILAGDYLKTASDLGLPLVGVGILFQEGYFRQSIDASGNQCEAYPYNDPMTLPVQPVTAASGAWLRIPVDLPGRKLWLRVWRATVGHIVLYLLDANEPINDPVDRGVTAKLYGGSPETRLLQELVLGIGGWRVLAALGLKPTIAHLNEGHAAFVVLERTRELMAERGLSFRDALWATRAGNVFTTHTPVVAGFDTFSPDLMRKYFPDGSAYLSELSISFDELMTLGRVRANDAGEAFNMAHLAMRGSARTNAVSRLHGNVSKRLFSELYPRWPETEVPVDYVTNGVHVPTWDSRSADALWTHACGKDCWRGAVDRHRDVMANATDEELWNLRSTERADLVAYAQSRLTAHWARRGPDASAGAEPSDVLEAGALTLGFARRFAEYKRPNLLLRDPDRFARLLSNRERPVQIVIAGKAHPADAPGKRMIAEWLAFVSRPDVRRRAVFLEDYDMALAARLVAGVDVWINTPRRPWEACGTSGMKVLANGGLNLSELDGWWAEAHTHDVGWALGSDDATPDDARDAEALYALLEQQVVPEFYDLDGGVPRKWLKRVRTSMARLAPAFSSNRMLLEYVDRFYAPASEDHRRRVENDAALAKALSAWESTLASHWPEVRVIATEARARNDGTDFFAEAHLGGLPPDSVRVQLYAEPGRGAPGFCQQMLPAPPEKSPGQLFKASVATTRPAHEFTPRIVAFHPAARVPAECPFIAWADHGFTTASR